MVQTPMFFDWPLPKKAKAGSSKALGNAQAYSPAMRQGLVLAYSRPSDSRHHTPNRAQKKPWLTGKASVPSGVFEAPCGEDAIKRVGCQEKILIEKACSFGYKTARAKSDPLGEVMPMAQFLLDVLAQIVAGLLVVLILRLWR